MPLVHDMMVAMDDDAGDGLRIDMVFLLPLLNRLHHGLMGDMRGVGFERRWLDGPGGSKPVQEPVQLWWQRKSVVIAVATFQHRGRATEPFLRQERALQTQLAGSAQMQTLGVGAAPGELQQSGAART